jgi:hypothetical protein
VRAQRPETHLILDGPGQRLDEGEPPAHPTLAVLEAARELIE